MGRRAKNGVTPPSPIGVDRIPDPDTALNIAAEAVVSDSPVRLARVSVVVAGTAAGAAYDASKVADAAAANQVAAIPNAVGVYDYDWPCLTGLVILPGAGQTLAVAFY